MCLGAPPAPKAYQPRRASPESQMGTPSPPDTVNDKVVSDKGNYNRKQTPNQATSDNTKAQSGRTDRAY
tara:strand:- start:284 stop:490 length:207 start_codon:yes stop_codon:yes gene_type:complete